MSALRRVVAGGCDETDEHMSDHLEGDLRGLRAWRVARHLARCEHCQSALASLRRVIEQLASLGRVERSPSPTTVDAVVERIRHEQH